MNETAYLSIEPWMHSAMEKFWAGQTWNQAVRCDIEKLTNPQVHGPYSIGKNLIPEECSICKCIIGRTCL